MTSIDSRVISLDIETYGACDFTPSFQRELPEQTVFNPQHSLYVDGVAKEDLILTVALTLPKGNIPCLTQTLNPNLNPKPKTIPIPPLNTKPSVSTLLSEPRRIPTSLMENEPFSMQLEALDQTSSIVSTYLQQSSPGQTMVFQMHKPEERMRLAKWLSHSQVILGMNLQFDIQYLRIFPEFRFRLEHQLLIDLSVLNYLHDETRPEKSLKALGPVLGTHRYLKSNTLKGQKFSSPEDPGLLKYNAQDTHNTYLAISELARRISKDFPNSPKLSDWCIKFYSDTIWTCIRMSEAGIPMDLPALNTLENKLTQRITRCSSTALQKYGLLLEGTGSGKSKAALLSLTCDVIDGVIQCETVSQIKDLMAQYSDSTDCSSSLPSGLASYVLSTSSIRNNSLLQVTPKKKELSFSEENRNLLVDNLPKNHLLRRVFRLAKRHSSSQKLISSYCFPLLRHRRNRPSDRSSVLVPTKGAVHGTSNTHLAFPTWYPVPTFSKDSKGTEGGTLQGRITCKKPSAQTFPKSIKACIRSRYRNGAILEFDLSQIELRVAALLSGDAALMGAYRDGTDLHKQRALQIFGEGVESDPNFYDYRQAGKMINFADLFRSGSATMQSQLLAMTGQLLPHSFFRDIVNQRPIHRPGLYKWQDRIIRDVRQNGYCMLSFTGQSRYFLGGDKWDVNEIVNFPVQTTAGNTLLRIQHRIHKHFLPSINSRRPCVHMFLNIYDALYVDCKQEAIDPTIKAVASAINLEETEGYWSQLQDLHNRKIPLEWGVEINKR